MLEAACERAQGVVPDQVYFTLDTDKFKRFIDILDAPPAANPGLKRLLAVEAPWDRPKGKIRHTKTDKG